MGEPAKAGGIGDVRMTHTRLTSDKLYYVKDLQATHDQRGLTADGAVHAPEPDLEVWRKVPGWPYLASTFGRIRRVNEGRRPRLGNPIIGGRFQRNKDYSLVCLNDAPRKLQLARHQVIAMTFLGPIPEGMEIHHKDHDGMNNRVDNLEYVTSSRNKLESVKAGRWPIGSRRWNAKLTEDQVRDMHSMSRRGQTHKTIAEAFGVTPATVCRIVNGQAWKHIAAEIGK